MSVDDVARESLVNWSENETDRNRDLTSIEEEINENNDAKQSRTTAEENGSNITEEVQKLVTNVIPKHEIGRQKEGVGTLDVTGRPEEEIVEKKEGDSNINKVYMFDKAKSDCDVGEMEPQECISQDDAKSKAVVNPLDDVIKVSVCILYSFDPYFYSHFCFYDIFYLYLYSAAAQGVVYIISYLL